MKGTGDRITRSVTKAQNLEEPRRAIPKENPDNPRMKFDGVVMERQRKSQKDLSQPPMTRNNNVGQNEVMKNVGEVEPLTNVEENSNSRPTESRPFDKVLPLEVRPIPRNTPKNAPPHMKHVRFEEENGPAYRIRNELFQPGLEEDLADKILKSEVTLTAAQVIQLSTKVQNAVLRKNKNKRVPVQKLKAFLVEIPDEDDPTNLRGIPVPSDDKKPAQWIDIDDLAPIVEHFEVLLQDEGNLKAGSIVQRDIVDMFKQDLPDDDPRKNITIVARSSEGLRVLYPCIGETQQKAESIGDPGSQIVSMDKMVAVGLGVSWDPTTVIHMESAHGHVQPTEGLARNVPFRFREITVYLQVHIINKAPYQVLLGRPFDALTESLVKNFANGEQEITIVCPNTGKKCTMPTYPRGKPYELKYPMVEALKQPEQPESNDQKENF